MLPAISARCRMLTPPRSSASMSTEKESGAPLSAMVLRSFRGGLLGGQRRAHGGVEHGVEVELAVAGQAQAGGPQVGEGVRRLTCRVLLGGANGRHDPAGQLRRSELPVALARQLA